MLDIQSPRLDTEASAEVINWAKSSDCRETISSILIATQTPARLFAATEKRPPNYTMGAIEGVFTEKAPKPLPQFSQAVKYNGMVYVSGNIGLDAVTWKVVEGTVKDRTVRSNSRSLAFILCQKERCTPPFPA